MSTLKYIHSLLLIAFASIPTMAQDSIVNRNVTVEREYKPVIQSAGKIKSTPKILEPKVSKITPKYSEFNLALNVEQNVHTLPAATPEIEKLSNTNTGYARIGLGNHFNSLADFAFPVVKTSDIKLDFAMNHLGTFGSKAHSATKMNLLFNKYFEKMDVYAGMGGGHEYFNYYGNNFNNKDSIVDLKNMSIPSITSYTEQNLGNINRTAGKYTIQELANDSINNTIWRYNAFLGIRSLPMTTGMRYDAGIHYNSMNSKNGFIEHLIHTKADFDLQNGKNRYGVDVDIYNLSYQSNNPAITNFLENYSIFSLNPYYQIERTEYNVRLGLKANFSFAKGHPFKPTPDIYAEWRVLPKFLAFYSGITGEYTVNSMDKMLTENRYLFNDVKVNDTYTPFNFFAGLKLKPVYNVLLDGYLNYRRIDNQYFFINKEYKTASISNCDSILYSNRFNVLYSGASQLKIGARLNYNFKNIVNIELKGAYNSWKLDSSEPAWNKPKWEANINTDIHLTQYFTLSANTFYEGERYAKIGSTAVKMGPKLDINVGGSYLYNEWLTTFIKVNNLINSRYQNYYGYDSQGFNALLGLAITF